MNFLARKQKVQNLCQYSESFWQTWFNYINKHRHHSILLACKEKKNKKKQKQTKTITTKDMDNLQISLISHVLKKVHIIKSLITARRQDFSEGVSLYET